MTTLSVLLNANESYIYIYKLNAIMIRPYEHTEPQVIILFSFANPDEHSSCGQQMGDCGGSSRTAGPGTTFANCAWTGGFLSSTAAERICIGILVTF